MHVLRMPRAWEQLQDGDDSHVGMIRFDPELQGVMGPGYDNRVVELLMVGDSPRHSYIMVGGKPDDVTYHVRSKFLLPEGTKDNPVEYKVVPRVTRLDDVKRIVDIIDIVLASDPKKVVVRIDVRPAKKSRPYYCDPGTEKRVGRMDITWECLKDGREIVRQILAELTNPAYVSEVHNMDEHKVSYVLRSEYFAEAQGLEDLSLECIMNDLGQFSKLPRYDFALTDTGETEPMTLGSSYLQKKFRVDLLLRGEETPRHQFFVWTICNPGPEIAVD